MHLVGRAGGSQRKSCRAQEKKFFQKSRVAQLRRRGFGSESSRRHPLPPEGESRTLSRRSRRSGKPSTGRSGAGWWVARPGGTRPAETLKWHGHHSGTRSPDGTTRGPDEFDSHQAGSEGAAETGPQGNRADRPSGLSRLSWAVEGASSAHRRHGTVRPDSRHVCARRSDRPTHPGSHFAAQCALNACRLRLVDGYGTGLTLEENERRG
jgi:hypothetical protein